MKANKRLAFTDYILPPAEDSILECIKLGLVTRDENGKIRAVEQPKEEPNCECHKKPSDYAKT